MGNIVIVDQYYLQIVHLVWREVCQNTVRKLKQRLFWDPMIVVVVVVVAMGADNSTLQDSKPTAPPVADPDITLSFKQSFRSL